MYVNAHVCMYVCMYVCITYIQVHKCTYIHVHVHLHTCTYIHTYTHACICIELNHVHTPTVLHTCNHKQAGATVYISNKIYRVISTPMIALWCSACLNTTVGYLLLKDLVELQESILGSY